MESIPRDLLTEILIHAVNIKSLDLLLESIKTLSMVQKRWREVMEEENHNFWQAIYATLDLVIPSNPHKHLLSPFTVIQFDWRNHSPLSYTRNSNLNVLSLRKEENVLFSENVAIMWRDGLLYLFSEEKGRFVPLITPHFFSNHMPISIEKTLIGLVCRVAGIDDEYLVSIQIKDMSVTYLCIMQLFKNCSLVLNEFIKRIRITYVGIVSHVPCKILEKGFFGSCDNGWFYPFAGYQPFPALINAKTMKNSGCLEAQEIYEISEGKHKQNLSKCIYLNGNSLKCRKHHDGKVVGGMFIVKGSEIFDLYTGKCLFKLPPGDAETIIHMSRYESEWRVYV